MSPWAKRFVKAANADAFFLPQENHPDGVNEGQVLPMYAQQH